MSYQVFFSFSTGLSKAIKVPVGTKNRIQEHVEYVESTLGIEREQYLDNPVRWKSTQYEEVEDEILCEVAETHNSWIIRMYDLFARCSDSAPDAFEEITPEEAQEFWPAISEFIRVPSHRWTGDYYTKRMETLYEVMRGRPTEGISFGTKKLTQKQASQVIVLFSEFLDHEDRDLAVPRGEDYLASDKDGGYEWCEKCGAVTEYYAEGCEKKKCPVQEEWNQDDTEA